MIAIKCWMLLVPFVTRKWAVAHVDTSVNAQYEDRKNLSSIASIFSPRMDFDQWKPLTGRGDPLRQDPTYDYEPPLLERVHYWLDDTRIEREHFPERKSEVLMLGVSSRRPSLGSRMPPMIPRRHQRPQTPIKYEDFAYKISDRFPMTILVPPPPPPPLSIPSHFVRPEDKLPVQASQTMPTTPAPYATESTPFQDHITSSYALQEANLIYQSSSTNINNWILELQNSTTPAPKGVSSDYSGWGPTTLIDDNNVVNESFNLISSDYPQSSDNPYTFYRPMLSEAPPPLQPTPIPFEPTPPPTFIPTAPPTTVALHSSNSTQSTWSNDETINNKYEELTTQKLTTYHSELVTAPTIKSKPETTVLDMISSMMSMPLVDGPDRPEDNLYAHASEHLQVYKEHFPEDNINIETMQTMQPPPIKLSETTTASQQKHSSRPSSGTFKKPNTHTHDPYLHMRFTTPLPNTKSTDLSQTEESTTPSTPMYLIIQGHSKVKTYSAKPDIDYDKNTILTNEIPKVNRTNEVKHLHATREQNKGNKIEIKRKSKSHSDLKTLIENGHGSIEIQETDIGIKYDVSDGSNVPVEIYRKGIVENDENAYSLSSQNKIPHEKREKRQIDLEDLIPFDEDTIEEYVYNFLDSKKNSTGITGLLAQAVTSDAAGVVDELEDDDSDEER
ncbi:mucin-2 [Plodia interpunctella]|uniref:mucin-2 n=1 Tax=Plodia interpunctella TaxID=58824 RepID=UPI002368D5F0|nr:proteoglycan 4 [Plodia interpunctella]